MFCIDRVAKLIIIMIIIHEIIKLMRKVMTTGVICMYMKTHIICTTFQVDVDVSVIIATQSVPHYSTGVDPVCVVVMAIIPSLNALQRKHLRQPLQFGL
jgi:hypothetical protein